jgi:SatD family (SatD)
MTSSRKNCIAVIGDVVESRRIRQRAAAQQSLQELLALLNGACGDAVLAPFSLSRGDEIQALVVRADVIPDVLWHAAERFPHSAIRFGFGLGHLTTPLAPLPMLTDGPAWWAARTALENAAATRRNGGVWEGFGSNDPVLTAFGTLLDHIRGKMTPRQRGVVTRLRAGAGMVQAAEGLGISKQAVHGSVRAAGWRAYEEGETAWKVLLREYDYTREWKRARLRSP